jgi:major membrane immunogen (membrane-anchored lipoprotein)
MRLYKAEGNVGFIAYVVNPGEYVPVASEAIFHLDADGDIVDFKLLNWVVGYDKEKYDAPPSYSDELLDTYIGKDNWDITGAALVSGATGTSSALRASVADVLRYVVINCTERSEEKVIDLASRFVPFASGFEAVSIDGMPETVKHLYKTKGVKSGYVAHVVVAGAYTPIATEALIYFDRDGVIADIELLIWNVGHGVEPGDFAEGFIGKTKDDISEVELVSAATGTSSDFKTEVAKIIPLIPIASDLPVVFGAVATVLVLAGFVAALIYFKRRNRAK